jgi:hypothetical protein
MATGEFAVMARAAVTEADGRSCVGVEVAADPPAIAWAGGGWLDCVACPLGRCNARATGEDPAIVATCTPVRVNERFRVIG